MHYWEKDSVGWLTFPALEALPFVRHAFSTRLGGVSTGEFSSMNLNFGRGDPRETVEENFRRFCAAAGFSMESLTASAQDHHTTVRRVGAAERGVGVTRPRDRESVDGLITDDPPVTLVTYYADCTPLFFVDPAHRAVGLGHSGWRGTAAGMGACMVRRMEEEFGSRPEEIIAAWTRPCTRASLLSRRSASPASSFARETGNTASTSGRPTAGFCSPRASCRNISAPRGSAPGAMTACSGRTARRAGNAGDSRRSSP